MYIRQNLAVGLVLAISMVGISYGAGGVLPGDGLSESTAYLIEDLADFDVFADPCSSTIYWSSGVYTKLACDPNLTGRIYATAVIAPDTPDTGSYFDGIPFKGFFDGNDHVVRNLTIDTAGADNDYLGLFGRIGGSGAQVKNLGLENINITGGDDSWYLGGLCGFNFYGTIANCYATGSVTGGDNSYYLGGLCGRNYGTITNCYSTGSVIGDDSLGGLCGHNSHGSITNCYAAGSVTGDNYLGGLCGYNFGTIANCFWDVETSGMTTSFGGKGLITEQMKDPQIYAMNGWAEDSAWVIDAHQDYPRLAWQQTQGTTIPAAPDISGHFEGNGNEQDPFIIYAAADLDRIATASIYFDQHYVLANDIDMSGRICVPIGYCRGTGFSGSFDGNHHKIQNLSITGSACLGLFGSIEGSSAEIKNLGIENINIISGINSYYLGGLCGYNYKGIITNCYAAGPVTGGYDSYSLGGLVGYNWDGTITNCYATGSVTGGDDSYSLGGLCGANNGQITNCYATGSVAGGTDSDSLGGLCGKNYCLIANCYASGAVTGGDDAGSLGGLCGRNEWGPIANCYAAGLVTGGAGSWYLGGLCGDNLDGPITNCYAAGSVTGGDDSDSLGGLCGYNWDGGPIFNCYATGSVTGGDNSYNLGGLCGKNYCGPISNCYATGSVTGRDDSGGLGGLCGYNYCGWINNCYATGSVTGDDYLGGLCGKNDYGTITNCFWDVQTSGIGSEGDDNYGATGKTTEQMQTESTFTDANWDFDVEPLWKMPFYESGYPILAWLWNGDGSQEKPYLIENMADFDVFADPCNSATYWSSGVYTKLACDIDLTGRQYTTAVIAPDTPDTGSSFDGIPFEGVFDGNGHTIRNLTIDTVGAGNDYLGLFGQIEDSSAAVKNLSIENINITGGTDSGFLGGLCGQNGDWDNPGGTITNCYATVSVTGGDNSFYLGGMCGYNLEGTITNCYAAGSVTGDDFLGGLCGDNRGTITNCYATGSVTGGDHSDILGGLCGWNIQGTITNCYATGAVIGGYGSHNLGSLCGYNLEGTITNCYATGSVTGGFDSHSLGGLCGYNYYGTITNSYATGSVIGEGHSGTFGGLCGNNDYGTITNCHATGPVISGAGLGFFGGLCGFNNGTISDCYAAGSVTSGDYSCGLGGLCGNNYGIITNCYATGSVTGGDYSASLGGLCGHNLEGIITNCYSGGSVTGEDNLISLGGLCGHNDDGTISNCFWDVETSGMTDGVGNQDPDPAGVIGKTTVQMQTESTFTDVNWDFTVVPVWHMPFQVVGYPMLGWQKDIPGDFTGRYGVYMDDFAIFSNAWLSDNSPTANWNEHCDLNGNGVIDPGDLKTFAEHWLCK